MTNTQRRLTSKMESFARGVAIEKLGLSDAYRAVYDAAKMTPKSINDAASKLAAHPAVAQRIEVLRGRTEVAALKKAALTLEQSLGEAGELLEDAQALGQISAGVAAAALRAKLSGLLVEKTENPKGALTDMDVMSLIKMRDEIEAELQRAADALELVGPPPTTAAVVVPMRRVIG